MPSLADFLNADSKEALGAVKTVPFVATKPVVKPKAPAPPAGPGPVRISAAVTLKVVLEVPKARLERLKIDRKDVALIVGEPCPCCSTQLVMRTVIWPSGIRPAGNPESAWHCGRCRQYYVYVGIGNGQQ